MFIATASITTALAVIAPILTIIQSGAQAMRIRSTGADGVSLATWMLTIFVTQTWLCYGFVFHVPAEIWANVPALVVAIVVALLAAQSQAKLAVGVAAYFGLSALTFVAVWSGSTVAHHWTLSLTAVFSSVVIYLPQLALVVRPRNLTGVSAVSWFVACLTAFSWLVYGLLIHQIAVALPSFVMLPAAVVILIQVLRHRLVNDSVHGATAPTFE